MIKLICEVAVVCGVLLAPRPVAWTAEPVEGRDAPPRRGIEIAAGSGLVMGTGRIGESQARVEELSGPGAAFELELGARVSDRLSLGAYGSHAQLAAGRYLAEGSRVRGAAAGLYAAWRFDAGLEADPWLRLSSGWRLLQVAPRGGEDTTYQGWELLGLRLGVELRLARGIVLGPVIGVGVSLFLTQDGPQTNASQRVIEPGPTTLFFAGLQARFVLPVGE